MTDLADSVEALKRYVAVPGTFADTFTETTDEDLAGSLLDGFAECQLDGFFVRPPIVATDDGVITPDLARGQVALVVLYAATRIIHTQLLNLKSKIKYEAKGLIYETEQSSNVLTQILKDLQARKALIIQRQTLAGASAAFTMADGYFVKAVGVPYYGDAFYGQDVDRAYDFHNPFGQ
jgi:hypothetical protein